MKNSFRFGLVISLVLGLNVVGNAQSAGDSLISAGSEWRFNDTGTDLGAVWTSLDYVDQAWGTGAAELGYGDGGEATLLGYGPDSQNKYPCYYFRHAFNVADPGVYETLSLDVLRDDGCVVYLNGQEVTRLGMPGGTITYATYASSATEYDWDRAISIPNLLVSGPNVVAVEVHQGNASSSDLSFNLALTGTYRAPAVTLTAPIDQAVLPGTTVQFTIDAEDPAGLATATLLIASPPQTLVLTGPMDTVDAEIRQTEPGVNFGAASAVNVDGQNPHAHAVVQFPSLIGSEAGQLRMSTAVGSALLRVYCTNPGNTLRIHRLTEDWVEGEVTWNERASGVPWGAPGADGSASHAPEEISGDCSGTGWRTIDVTSFVQAWSDGDPNYGFVLIDSGTDGVDFESSESGTPPELVVTFGGQTVHTDQQSLTGSTATIQFDATLNDESEYVWNCEVVNTSGLGSWAATDNRFTVDSHYPEIPVLVQPANGATGVPLSPELKVTVSHPDNDPLDVTFYGRGGNAVAGDFTIIMLPDTQKYVLSSATAPIFMKQTQWIVDQRDAMNIVFVTHVGDVCDNYDSVSQHIYAAQSLSLLDGVVPYGVLPGNHDQPTTLYNSYWPYSLYESESWFGGHYPANGNDNSFQSFSAGGMDFLILHLQFNPDANVIAWADSVLKNHPNHKAIISTHGFLNVDGSRSVTVMGSTQYIWDDLVVPNENVHFVLCGHMHGEFYRMDTVNGREVHQLLADYQEYPEGGEGWLRIMRFEPAQNAVTVRTYSPHFNSYQTDSDSEFTLHFPMNGFAPLGTVPAIPSGTDAQFVWSDLEPDATYDWHASASDSTGRTSLSPMWTFSTGPSSLPPEPDAQAVTVDEDQSVDIQLTATDPENDPMTFQISTPPGHGAVSLVNSTATYTPTPDFNGLDQFQFTVSDGTTVSSPAMVTLTIIPVNDPPLANGATVSVAEDNSILITLTGSDVESAPLSFAVGSIPANGNLAGTAPNLTYTPIADYNGADSLTFTVSDGELSSAAASVTIDVTPVNDPPTAVGQTLLTQEDSALNIKLTGLDVEGDALTFAVQSPPLHGSLSGTASDLVYTPDADFAGQDGFSFTANDGTLDSAPATVSLEVVPVNDPPVAQDQSLQTEEDAALNLTLEGSDVDGDTLTFSVSTGPQNGTLSGTAPALTYTPNPGYSGSDNFNFVANDGTVDSAPAAVQITVTEFNDPPVPDPQNLQTDEDTPLSVTLTASDSDTDPGELVFAVLTVPTSGSLSGTAPDLVYTPNADYSGPDSLTFTVSDGELPSAAASVTIDVTPVNDPPTAVGQTLLTQEDTALNIKLTGLDVEGDALTFAVQSPPQHGILSGTASDLVYTPDADFAGQDSFSFTANDGSLDSTPATVSLEVVPVNDPPVAQGQSLQTDEDIALNITLGGSDVDGDTLTFSVSTGPQNGTLTGTAPALTYTPNPGYSGSDSFSFVANDGTVDSTPATVQITVTPAPSEAEVFRDSFEIGEWNGLWTEDRQNDWFRSTQRATDGSYSAEIDGRASDASLTSTAIDLQGRTSARITFDWLIEKGLDAGEYLDFRISTDGGFTWQPIAILAGNVDPENTWQAVNLEFTGINQLQLQFRGKISGSSEDANVDNVVVVAF